MERRRRGRGRGPRLHLKLSNEIYHREMRLFAAEIKSYNPPTPRSPPPFSCFRFRQTEERGLMGNVT